MMRSWF